MESQLELKLLKDRFPQDSLIETCGSLVSEFFCARAVNNHSYEGRIFVTEKAFFFVSTFSVAASYDVSFSCEGISQVIAYQRIIPSIEIIVNEIKEEFTNFHDLQKTLKVFQKVLPDGIKIDTRKQAYLSRLVSVPMKEQTNPPAHQVSKSTVVCPYFSQSGFCPRREFCRFIHDLTLPPPSSVTSSPLENITNPQLLFRSISTPSTAYTHSQDVPNSVNEIREVSSSEEIETKPSHWSDDVAILSPYARDKEESTSSEKKEEEDKDEVVVKRKNGADDIFNIRQVSSPTNSEEKDDTPAECYYEYGSEYDSGDDIPAVEIPSKLTIYPASMIARSDINSGDKIILFPEVLMACEQKQLSYPMAFCFENKANNRIVYCGVLEFSNPVPNTAYLPQWMFDHLGVDQGQEVDFNHVDLPKGTFIQLQPVSAAWLSVPHDKRAAVMEFQLRNFQTLTEGTKVTIVYELNRYTFKVLKCKPAKGISIIDADVTTDFIEPADMNRFHSIEEGQAEHIPLDEPLTCTLLAGQYRHFVLLSLFGQELPPSLTVEVKQELGDPDLFLCQTCSAPTQSRYTWCCQTQGNTVIVLGEDDKDYKREKSLFGGVVSLCDDTTFTICFRSNHSTEGASLSGSSGGHVLRSATGSSDLEEDREQSTNNDIPPGHEQCSYCGSVMPQLRLLMHSRHCAQSTFKCPICKQCFPKSMEKKHHYIAHEILMCDCGVEMTQLALHHHQLTECVKRSVRCQFKWCQLSYPLDQMEQHENRCGRKLVACPVCSEEIPQLELEMHLEAFHSVEVDKLDWTKPLSSQNMSFTAIEPNYKCHCGEGFEYEDDFQVHQLTVCSPQPTSTESDSEDVVG